MTRRVAALVTLLMIAGLMLPFAIQAQRPAATPSRASTTAQPLQHPTARQDQRTEQPQPKASHRLIVELESPSLAEWAQASPQAFKAGGQLNVRAPAAQTYIATLQAEQAAVLRAMTAVLPAAQVSSFINERGVQEQTTYQVVFNGLAIDPGTPDRELARAELLRLPGVKQVYLDYARAPNLYSSNNLINAAAAWNNSLIGGRAHAGAGIKLASMDGGVHKDAPMFNGAGYSYPPDYPVNGLGLTQNNNGKIIASRAYFRSWDGPSPGDENPWPGTRGTSHGVHTAGIAAGNEVTGSYLGRDIPDMSGVAPRAWVMSYRVFYNSVTNDGSFYDAEGIAALEDIAADNADVLNNSWGAGPASSGGEFDALDRALINTATSGVFVAMSAGNSGPGMGTTDHASAEYISVAATSTDGTFAAGSVDVTAPEPISPTLQGMLYAAASFGAPLPTGQVLPYAFKTAAAADPDNVNGCTAWPAGTFTGKLAVIQRGSCDFSAKVLHAQNAGATAAIIYNHTTGGEGLLGMSPGTGADQVTISSIFVGHSKGQGMVSWYATHADAARLEISTVAFQTGNTPDVVASFSSRGPGVGLVLKPDIAAPGVNIMSQGYAPGAEGEAAHLGYGQVSGTSMAAPHVAGAAALLRQMHPTWSNAFIKSALMSTAKYTEIYNHDGSPAQPLDIGAGRLDLTRAADPGVILSPPSLSFGEVDAGTPRSIQVTLTSVASAPETYYLASVYTGDGFDNPGEMAGLSFEPNSVTLAPGASATVSVTFDPSKGRGGDNQGYLILDGPIYEAHMPAWARVASAPAATDVLIIDNDGSTSISTANYLSFYTDALDALDMSYTVVDANASNGPTSIPDATELASYPLIIYFTGDNYRPDGATDATGLTELDMDRLTEYANGGGRLIAMGQDLAAVLNSNVTDDGRFFFSSVLGANWLQDSVTNELMPTLSIISVAQAAPALRGLSIDVGASGNGAHNQTYIDELKLVTKDPTDQDGAPHILPLLRYPGSSNLEAGTVGLVHRQQPTLERPGITYDGRSVYTTFGLEGVNNNTGTTSRSALLDTFIDYLMDAPTVTISDTPPDVGATTNLSANLAATGGATGATYRWDFGDGTPYTSSSTVTVGSHSYALCGLYTVRVEATDGYGNKAIGSMPVNVTTCETHRIYVPLSRH